jgi:hypothetical protein
MLAKVHLDRGDMHIYGYEDKGQPFGTVVPALLAEITLNATPEELRAMAEFLCGCADEMDRMGESFDHVHLSDRQKQFETSPHFVVARG